MSRSTRSSSSMANDIELFVFLLAGSVCCAETLILGKHLRDERRGGSPLDRSRLGRADK